MEGYSMNPIKVLILDDHKAICSGLSNYLNKIEEFKVVAAINKSELLLKKLSECEIHVLIIDIKLNNDNVKDNGLKITKKIRGKGIDIPIVIYSGYNYLPYEEEAFRSGANAFVSKNASLHELSDAVKLVSQGLTIRKNTSVDVEHISDKEKHVLNLMSQGYTNKQIAAACYVSPRTVEYYITSLYDKLNVDSRIQAVVRGIKYGYITEENI